MSPNPCLQRCTLSVVLTWFLSACLPRQEDVDPQASDSTSQAPPVREGDKRSSPRPNPPAGKAAPSPDPVLTEPFVDGFDRAVLGPNWRATSSQWRLDQGRLCASGARNPPAWLKRRLPRNARIEFEATSFSADGDIKAEYWGDGRSRPSGVSYDDATSYLTIWGGWKNRYHVLARLDEHAKDRRQLTVDPAAAELRRQPVQPERTYRFRVERKDGKTVTWHVDGEKILVYPDPQPLRGAGHEHFGYNNWEVRVCFDNLKVTPLDS